jgi:hypothetical protein
MASSFVFFSGTFKHYNKQDREDPDCNGSKDRDYFQEDGNGMPQPGLFNTSNTFVYPVVQLGIGKHTGCGEDHHNQNIHITLFIRLKILQLHWR